MKRRVCLRLLFLSLTSAGLLALGAGSGRGQGTSPAVVRFNRDIRPILSNNCFACHGPDRNNLKAHLRLDKEKDVFADRDGTHVVVPGQPGKSELFLRITAQDPDERMPPKKTNKQLTPHEIDLLRRWIEQGARWENHWSLIAAKRPELPAVADQAWPQNAIDCFTLARMERHGLHPSPEADRRTLLRRLSFDLIGLPPTPAEVDAFLADRAADAYEKQVDRLLASKHFGERLAIYWLDVVRYADTGGYHSDNHRDVAPYRDYVINAFNDNLRFDQFTIDQLAGDLLLGATREQKIASGYNRLLQTTEEGGAQAKEYTAKYAADRVRNTATAWLGTTLGCCECHDHKFDPVTTKEFYRFAAFFADVKERAVGRQEQTTLPTAEQTAQVQRLERQIAPLQRQLDAAQTKWEETARKDSTRLPPTITAIVKLLPAQRNPQQQKTLAAHFAGLSKELGGQRKQFAELQRQKDALTRAIPSTLVSMAGPPRVVRILPRGNWLDDSGEVVAPGVPASLPSLDVQGRRATRLDLARWLVAADNPLTARVFVNRLWRLLFGQGIVKTADDFGAQGAWPTHPDLLDWLAVEFRDSGWDIKRLLKLMVLSRTYRQASQAPEPLRHQDPYNQWLARQGRFRLDAELVRDNALAVSGLLNRKIGGPSVKPYQPAGYWQYLNFPRRTYVADKGPDQYRRGMYTYWQRTFPHPSLLAFDAPSREECTVERPRSNTPQQALVLLNDPTYVEAARVLAERIVREGGPDVAQRIHFALRQVLQRRAQPEETKLLSELYRRHHEQYVADRGGADGLLHVGDRPVPADLPAPELAAWTSVARVILNLHETITRE
jgi:Protein of unknown function (DUF1553)/Protein of unknown function (DUF1549)/Planctomycete cytochrome C